MTNPEQIKNQLGQTTEAFETKIKELAPEPYQRGALILALIALLLISIYLLTKSDPTLIQQKVNQKLNSKEKELEERILRQMAFYKRLKE